MRCPTCDHDNIQGVDLCEHCGMDLAGLDFEAWGVDPEDPILVRKLGEIPLKAALTLDRKATVGEAIELMRQFHEGCVFVLDDDGALEGVVTERDITARVAAPGRDPEHTTLESVMTPNPVTLTASDPLAFALFRMGVDGYRHLPVLSGERLAGFLSVRTVLEVLHSA